MSILIKGMEMPNACIDCPLFSEWGDCSITHKWTWSDEFPLSENRMPDCPLVEIPAPHGRLVDADVMVEGLMKCAKNPPDDDKMASWFYLFAAEIAKACPTIIEAEGGGEDA